jgi:hypothetical protein
LSPREFLSWPFAPLQRSSRSAALSALSLSGSLPRVPPLRFLPLQRFLDRGQPLTSRGYHSSGYVASSAFRTLSRLFSARGPPALFHAGPALGVFSLQGPSASVERFAFSGISSLLWFFLSSILRRIGLAGWCSSLGQLHHFSVSTLFDSASNLAPSTSGL